MSKIALFLFFAAVVLLAGAPPLLAQSALDGFDPNANGITRGDGGQPDARTLLSRDLATGGTEKRVHDSERRQPQSRAVSGDQMSGLNAPLINTCTDYTAVTSMGNGIVAGTADTGNHCDDCTTTIAFPFPVTLYGATYTSGVVSSNGNIQFTGNSAYRFRDCPLPDLNLGAAIIPYQGDLRTDAAGSGIFTSVTGVAPNRVFHVEWRATLFTGGGAANFEARFFEGSPKFEIIYGATADNGSAVESGVQESGTGRATAFSCNEATLPAGLKVTYSCPGIPCNDYMITRSTGFLNSGNTDTGNHCDDCTTSVAFPFPLRLYGTSYTSGIVSSNGNLQFGSNTADRFNADLPVAGFNATVFPFWDDLRTDTTNSFISSSVTGAAPNRIFNLEWRASRFGADGDTSRFGVQFRESTPNFEIIYGQTLGTAFSGTVGVQQTGGALSTQAAGSAANPPADRTRLVFTQGCCPAVGFSGNTGSNSSSYPGVSGTQAGRINRNGVTSVCATPKAYPGNTADSARYDAYTFINNGPATCVTFSINIDDLASCTGASTREPSGGPPPPEVLAVAYLGSFNPANIAMNYLGDPGSTGSRSFSVDVPANATVVLVISEVFSSGFSICNFYSIVATGLGCQPITLVSAASRKTHGAAGTFDIPLPLTGEPGVECRGTGGNHTLVFNFNNLVISGIVQRVAGTATVGAPTFSGKTMTVPLTGVTDIQKVTLNLKTVESITGEVLPNTAVSVNMLLGDTTGNKTVNATDVSQTKLQSGNVATATNFRTDVTVSGTINATDVSQVKLNSGHGVP